MNTPTTPTTPTIPTAPTTSAAPIAAAGAAATPEAPDHSASGRPPGRSTRHLLRELVEDWRDSELPNWIYVFKMVAAALLALGIGYALDLESPRSAMITVFIVMQPQSGMILSKSINRVVGTLVRSRS